MKISQIEWAGIRERFIAEVGGRGLRLALRDRVWATTREGGWVALPGTSDSPDADKWWLGCDPDKLHSRAALGVILLCQARGGPRYAIGLPRALLRQLEPKLTKKRQ